MQVTIYEAKTQFSKLIAAVEKGEEIIVSRRNQPVARITAIRRKGLKRIGVLSGKKLHLTESFDSPAGTKELADDFGIAHK